MKRRYLSITALLLVIIFAISFAVLVGAQDATGNMISLDHPYAAFLESRAYGVSRGATAEFRKMEWLALDTANMKYYLTMSDINEAMSDGAGAISVDENRCGIVYVADLTADYNITELRPLIVGGPFNPNGGANLCNADNIANPDGLQVDARGRVWIAEDSGNHENNMLWVYDPADGSLKRFAALPVGAEVTGTFVTEQGTVFVNIQHPADTNPPPYNLGTMVVINGYNANTDDFESLPLPEGDARSTLSVAAGTPQILMQSGNPLPNNAKGQVWGGLYRANGSVITVVGYPDGNMWVPLDDMGTSGWMYTNFETRPGAVSRLMLYQTAQGWEVIEGEMIDFSSVRGTWNNCGGSVTPWNTALTSEEFEPYAGDFANVASQDDYLGTPANPYDYGWNVEMHPDGQITKHYAMGRKSNENARVAPDLKTVYFGDDGSNVMLFKFIATTPGDLSAGTLYAGRVTQSGGTSLTDHRFGIEWIELGTATNAEIEAAIRQLDR